MAKETIIVFVYDMEYCKAEEDDPAKAVLYFHPSWVSEQQKANLCGQIVGATHFLSVTFSPPRFISLQSGRFHLTIEDRYLIVVGTDRNVDDWILERRSNIIMSLLKFFHGDLTSVAEQTQNYNNLCAKLYSMFETYLKILYFSANTFSNTPLLNLPKSASSVFLEAIQILQYCQEMDTVLGGALLYHNKVLATQLDAELTKMLVMTDPYRIKSSAEIVHTDYNLPLGVQLMYVYIPYRKHISLSRDSSRLRSLSDPVSWAPQKKNTQKPKEQTFSAMKRDQSLLFTTVPEEDLENHTSPSEPTNFEPYKPPEIIQKFEKPSFENRPNRPKSLNLKFTTYENKIPNQKSKCEGVTTPFNYKTSVCSTPLTEKYLHFKPHNIISDTDIEMIEFNKNNEVEMKKTESVNSILSQNEKSNLKNEVKFENFDIKPSDFILPSIKIFDLKKSLSFVPLNKICQDFDSCQSKNGSSNNPCHFDAKHKSKNLEENGNIKPVFIRSYGLGLSNLLANVKNDSYHLYNTITDPNFPIFKSNGTLVSKNLYNSYVTRHYNLFNPDLLIDSNLNSITNTEDWKSLDDFDSEFKDSPKKIGKTSSEGQKINICNTNLSKKVENVKYDSCQSDSIQDDSCQSDSIQDDSCQSDISQVDNCQLSRFNKGTNVVKENSPFKRLNPTLAFKNLDSTVDFEYVKKDSLVKAELMSNSEEETNFSSENIIASKTDLTLPLKSFENVKNDSSDLSTLISPGPKVRPPLSLPLKSLSTDNDFPMTSFSRKNNGVQLTPLMSKLSLLAAIEDRSSGFCSRDTTPMTEFRDLMTPSDNKDYSFLRRGSLRKMESFESDDDDEFKKSLLFVCGQQDTVLTLLLDETAVENDKLIRNLWEICIDNLGQLETQLRQCLEQYPGATNGTSEISEDDSYSYLCLDPHWEATRRGGPWAISELGMLNQMHREFKSATELMEISLRNEDGIVYGYRCGETEVYYQQAASCNPGLPPPADAMGVAPLKAKRKLERDHGIILL